MLNDPMPDIGPVPPRSLPRRLVNGLDVCIRAAGPDGAGGETHSLWVGGFPVATVFCAPFQRIPARRDDPAYGWGYHSALSATPFGPFDDLDLLLDHFVHRLAGLPIACLGANGNILRYQDVR